MAWLVVPVAFTTSPELPVVVMLIDVVTDVEGDVEMGLNDGVLLVVVVVSMATVEAVLVVTVDGDVVSPLPPATPANMQIYDLF